MMYRTLRRIASALLIGAYIIAGEFTAGAQSPAIDSIYNTLGPALTGSIYQENYQDSENDPYLFSDWKIGSVRLVNGYIADNIELLYNTNRDLLIYKNPGLRSAVVIDKDMVAEFSLRNNSSEEIRQFKKVNFQALFINESQGRYSEVLEQGAYSVFVLRIKLKKGIDQGNPTKDKQYFFEVRDQYYLRSPDGKIVRFAPRNSGVINTISQHKKELRSYIRKEKLSAKRDKDLAKIIHYCSLLEQD